MPHPKTDQIVTLYYAGKAGPTIARELSMLRGEVYRILKAAKVTLRPKGRPVPPTAHNTSKAIAQAYTTGGQSIAKIAKANKMSSSAVRERLIAEGVPRRKPGRPSKGISAAGCLASQRAGMEVPDIARMVGASPKTVYIHIARAKADEKAAKAGVSP